MCSLQKLAIGRRTRKEGNYPNKVKLQWEWQHLPSMKCILYLPSPSFCWSPWFIIIFIYYYICFIKSQVKRNNFLAQQYLCLSLTPIRQHKTYLAYVRKLLYTRSCPLISIIGGKKKKKRKNRLGLLSLTSSSDSNCTFTPYVSSMLSSEMMITKKDREQLGKWDMRELISSLTAWLAPSQDRTKVSGLTDKWSRCECFLRYQHQDLLQSANFWSAPALLTQSQAHPSPSLPTPRHYCFLLCSIQ